MSKITRAQIEKFWSVAYTCECGLYVHPDNPLTSKNAFHMTGCVFTPESKTNTQLLQELSELWHISRTACAGNATRYNRLIWVSKEFSKANPEFSSIAYKAIDRMTAVLPASNDVAVIELFDTVLGKS